MNAAGGGVSHSRRAPYVPARRQRLGVKPTADDTDFDGSDIVIEINQTKTYLYCFQDVPHFTK